MNFLQQKIKCLACLGIILFFSQCTHLHKPLHIIHFFPFPKDVSSFIDDNHRYRTTKEDYFLMENYEDVSITTRSIDSFVNKWIQGDSGLLKYNNYFMYFFKKSSVTNIENIKKNPRTIDRYSSDHDLIYTYSWVDGKYQGSEKNN